MVIGLSRTIQRLSPNLSLKKMFVKLNVNKFSKIQKLDMATGERTISIALENRIIREI